MSKLPNLKEYIVSEFIPNGHTDEIQDDMDLLQSGILDSLALLKLVAFIEDKFNIALDPDEIDPENLKSINSISNLITKKKKTLTERI